MRSLEQCYEIDFSKISFIERKQKIKSNKTILYGAAKVGKSYLIYDYLSSKENKEYIYIDFDDCRNDIEEIKENLSDFISQHSIKTLVLENFSFEFDLPDCKNIIISTNINKQIKGFSSIFINPLDFEEYLLHETRYQNITQSFNNFLKYGNLPDTIHTEENKKITRLQEIIKLQCKTQVQYEILLLLIKNIDEKKSLYQLFNTLKKKIKISKDKFYETCKDFEYTNTIFFCEKYMQEKATKKIYTYNHSFLKAISHNKKFKNEFSNMVFLELFRKYKDIFYLDYVDFYIPSKNLAIVSIPFFSSMLFDETLKKIYKTMEKYHIKELSIITISNEEQIQHKELNIKVLPFYEWALG